MDCLLISNITQIVPEHFYIDPFVGTGSQTRYHPGLLSSMLCLLAKQSIGKAVASIVPSINFWQTSLLLGPMDQVSFATWAVMVAQRKSSGLKY